MFISSWTALNAMLMLSPVTAPADLQACENPVFFCRIAHSAHSVRLCEKDDQLIYTFSPGRGAPEKTFTALRADVTVQPWNGSDADYVDAIFMPHGIWNYRIFAMTPRGADTPAAAGVASAGITVLRNGQDVRHFTCDADSVHERVQSLQLHP
jgi:hypothetical protein